jgi:hypothetical protein
MSRKPMPVVAALVFASLVLLLPSRSSAGSLEPAVRAELEASGLVSPDLIEALDRSERVGARITFLQPAGKIRRQSRDGEEVSPVTLRLAQLLLPGEMDLVDNELVQSLRGAVNAGAVQALVRDPDVIGITLDETAGGAEKPAAMAKAGCVVTATNACAQAGRFSIQALFGGSPARLAGWTQESAVFWALSSTNWEVLAKVLNGCAINNRYWVFAAGATSQAFSVVFQDTVNKTIATFNFTGVCQSGWNTTFFIC